MSLIIHPADFALLTGELKQFKTMSDSGREKTCAFCPECGVRIYNVTSRLMAVKAGTLDDLGDLTPDAHYWITSKQKWVRLSESDICFDTAP